MKPMTFLSAGILAFAVTACAESTPGDREVLHISPGMKVADVILQPGGGRTVQVATSVFAKAECQFDAEGTMKSFNLEVAEGQASTGQMVEDVHAYCIEVQEKSDTSGEKQG